MYFAINNLRINAAKCVFMLIGIYQALQQIVNISFQGNNSIMSFPQKLPNACRYMWHLVTLYNVIFSNITGILSHLSYIFY